MCLFLSLNLPLSVVCLSAYMNYSFRSCTSSYKRNSRRIEYVWLKSKNGLFFIYSEKGVYSRFRNGYPFRQSAWLNRCHFKNCCIIIIWSPAKANTHTYTIAVYLLAFPHAVGQKFKRAFLLCIIKYYIYHNRSGKQA